jgi:predicted TIM-barrel fold metal-dependent hydrolase
LTSAQISDSDKRKIAGDNLRGLISWCGAVHEPVALPPPADDYVAYGRSGQRPAELPLFADNHGHMGGRACHYHLPNCDLDGIVADIRRYGVEKSVIFSYTGIFSDEQPGNDVVAEAVRRHPDLFVGFTMLNPHRGRDMMLAELERGWEMGLRGIKLIPTYQGYPEEGPNIDIACDWANERGLIMLNHQWGGPAQMERLVSTYSNVVFFTGHTTLAYADIMKRYPNLYVCSCPLIPPGICEQVVETVGADRFMFGSDLEDLPIAWGLGPILFARITADEKRLILGDNLRRVLRQTAAY